MLWVTFALCSALFLGFYDISKKKALTGNAVLPVLFFVSLTCTVLLLPALVLGKIPVLSFAEHGMLLVKAGIVTTSWIFTFNAVSRLPLSLTSPIRASAPVFTIALAVIFMGERPSGMEWLGIGLSLFSYLMIGFVSKKEAGGSFVWIFSMFLGTFLGSVSGVYDKFLLQRMHLDPLAIQFYFNAYMACLQGAGVLISRYGLRGSRNVRFEFRPVILAVGVLLVVADRFYFLAVHEPDALISVVTVIRRSNVLIGFAGGLLLFQEKKSRWKFLALSGILAGLVCFAVAN